MEVNMTVKGLIIEKTLVEIIAARDATILSLDQEVKALRSQIDALKNEADNNRHNAVSTSQCEDALRAS